MNPVLPKTTADVAGLDEAIAEYLEASRAAPPPRSRTAFCAIPTWRAN